MSNTDTATARRRALAAGAIGNFIEWYDFSLYGFFATTIAHSFFPKSDPTAALLSTFAIFGISLLVRPLGAVAFGHLADKIGRRPALTLSVVLMSAATVAMGVLPGYADIGIAAAVLLFICRLAQGFSAGGEYSGSAAFVIEHAPPGRRGRYASFVTISVFASAVFAVLVAMLTTSATTPEQLATWGWRLPFFVAAPLAVVGLYLRLRVDESPVFEALR
ncbi:MFS transporter, partial [Nocardia sp. NPDC059246]|uniref:MFS transporter n=1 Tax=Nocardia sp. NPDC059246 TaxID=3346789 RepID=UPI0036BBF653